MRTENEIASYKLFSTSRIFQRRRAFHLSQFLTISKGDVYKHYLTETMILSAFIKVRVNFFVITKFVQIDSLITKSMVNNHLKKLCSIE